MDKKIKVLLILLGLSALFAVIIAILVSFSAQVEIAKYTRNQSDLEKENSYLQKQVDSSQKDLDRFKDKNEVLNNNLNKLTRDLSVFQSKYEFVLRERDSLSQENKKIKDELSGAVDFYSRKQVPFAVDSSNEFVAAILSEKAAMEVEAGNLRAKVSAQQKELEDIKMKSAPSQKKIDALRKEISDLEVKWHEAQKVSDMLSNDLLEERKKRADLAQSLERAERQLDNIARQRDSFSTQLGKTKQDLEEKLVKLDQTKTLLESAVQDVENIAPAAAGLKKTSVSSDSASIQLPPIVVKADPIFPNRAMAFASSSGETNFSDLSGHVVRVVDKHKFVVIDLGKSNGVKEGMNFDVYNGTEKVGRLQIIEARQDISACDIKEVGARGFRVRDLVRPAIF